MKFFPIKIKDIIRETPDAVSIQLDIPKELEQNFAYFSGQHIALKHKVNGEELRRNYSLCSIPAEGWKIAIKQIEGGRFSSYANQELKAGDTLEVMPPIGNFTLDFNRENSKSYVAFAAGSGITPVISLIKSALETEPESQFLLIYGNKRQETILFRDELADLKNKYLGRFSVFHVLSQEKLGSLLQEGRIDKEKCAQFGKILFDAETVDQFLLCGPEEMIFSVKEQLEVSGVASPKIKFELFTSGQAKGDNGLLKAKNMKDRVAIKSHVEVKMDGNIFSFDLSSRDVKVLDAAIAAGADLPFSCKGGVCSTCKAKLLKGEVEMDRNFALEPDELAAGYILTCQSHPKTKELVIDFDQ